MVQLRKHPLTFWALFAVTVSAGFLALSAEKFAESTQPADPKVSPSPVPDKDSSSSSPDKSAPASGDSAPSSDLPTAFGSMANHFDRDADTSRLIVDLLEHEHYLHAPLDLDMSRRWLKLYIQSLDPTHLFFLQSDIDEFNSHYGAASDSNNLAGLLVRGDDDKAALMPAIVIYQRFLQRLNASIKIIHDHLNDKFDFTQSDTYPVRSEKSDWFKDKTEYESFWQSQVKADILQSLLDKAKGDTAPPVTDELLKKIGHSYDNLVRNEQDQEDTDGLQTYLNALCHSYDPHTDYFAPEAANDFQAMNLDVAIIGIGAQLRPIDGFPTVDDIVPGGPADQDKRLQKDDRIIAVGQGSNDPVDTINMPINKVVSLIRGKRGTLVHLVVVPAGSTNTGVHKDIILKRDKVVLTEAIAKADIIEHKQPDGTTMNIGVIKLPGFYNTTGEDVKQLLVRLKEQYNIGGVILDLRNDGGGLLDQALDLTALFAKHQPVVQIRDFANNLESLPTTGPEAWNGPLIVMVNKYSASASEIVAGALQDYGRALVVGDKSTHGKGTVQTFVSLDRMKPLGMSGDPGKLKLTVQKFYRVAGGSTQQMGIIPDIILPSKLDAFPLGETTLPYCLPYDTINKVPYTDYNLVAPYLPVLRQKSQSRVDGSTDFGYVKADVDYYKGRLDEKDRSLNFTTRLQQQNDVHDVWKKETTDIASRKSARDPVLELTLDDIMRDKPAGPPLERKPPITEDEQNQPENLDPTSDQSFDPQLSEAVSIMSDYSKLLKQSGASMGESTAGTATAPAAAATPH